MDERNLVPKISGPFVQAVILHRSELSREPVTKIDCTKRSTYWTEHVSYRYGWPLKTTHRHACASTHMHAHAHAHAHTHTHTHSDMTTVPSSFHKIAFFTRHEPKPACLLMMSSLSSCHTTEIGDTNIWQISYSCQILSRKPIVSLASCLNIW